MNLFNHLTAVTWQEPIVRERLEIFLLYSFQKPGNISQVVIHTRNALQVLTQTGMMEYQCIDSFAAKAKIMDNHKMVIVFVI